MTRKAHALDVDGLDLENVDTVVVPRPLVEEMSQAIAAMQTLAADGMISVAKGLGLHARKQRRSDPVPCADCHQAVAVGLPHLDGCQSAEAVRHRATEIPKLES